MNEFSTQSANIMKKRTTGLVDVISPTGNEHGYPDTIASGDYDEVEEKDNDDINTINEIKDLLNKQDERDDRIYNQILRLQIFQLSTQDKISAKSFLTQIM